MLKEDVINDLKDHFITGTYQLDVSRWIPFDGLIRMDFSSDPPLIYREKDYNVDTSIASKEEIDLVVKSVNSLPKLRPVMYIYQIHAIFTKEERAMIRGLAPDFVEMLLMADDPVDTSRIVPFLTQLYQYGLFSEERFFEIVGR